MESIEFLIALDGPDDLMTQDFRELLNQFDVPLTGLSAGTGNGNFPISFYEVREDFFDICIHYAEAIPEHTYRDLYKEKPEAIEDSVLIELVRDISFQEFKQYIDECDYFDYAHPDYPIFAEKFATLCSHICYWVDRTVIQNLRCFPQTKKYLATDDTVVGSIREVWVRRLPNRPDALITVHLDYD